MNLIHVILVRRILSLLLGRVVVWWTGRSSSLLSQRLIDQLVIAAQIVLANVLLIPRFLVNSNRKLRILLLASHPLKGNHFFFQRAHRSSPIHRAGHLVIYNIFLCNHLFFDKVARIVDDRVIRLLVNLTFGELMMRIGG